MRLLTFLSCVLGILFVVQNIHAVPTGNRVASCSKLECPKFSKFRYVTGKTYSFKYEVDVASVVDGVSGAQESRIHLSAKVHFDVNTPCDWTLRVSDVTLQDSEPLDAARKSSVPGEMAFKEALESSDLPFTFHDGLVPNICPAADEPVWSVNIKRGILSAFQNNMARLDLDHETLENDVAGTCKVNYVFYGAVQNTINVLKTRDLSSCTNRYGLSESLSRVQYRFLGAAHDSIQLTNSSGSCQQTIAANRITQIECDEKHVVRPFSHEGSGATTNVRQSLAFVDEAVMENNENDDSAKKADKSRIKSSLLYQHVKSKDSSSSSADSVLTLPTTLQRLCQNTEEGVGNEAAAAFGRLVRTLKTMDYPSLGVLMTDAANMCRDGDAARKHLLNGLISAATSDAVAAMVDEVVTGTVDPNLINQWVTSLAFIPRPTEKHLKAALPLLDMPSHSRQASLSISSLASKLCIGGCPSEVFLLVGKLSKQLGNSCQTRSREEREEIILALKSLANIGEAISGDHLDTVKNCFGERDNPAEVRVTALKAFRSIPCHVRGNAAMKILEDNSEDSEIRIAAYLGVMKCANYHTILDIKELLNKEEINQVGSFIWTHLKNLVTTSMPSKLNIQALILDHTLVKKFDTDARKFSRNYEKSILLDQYNTAASFESNIIFSQHSYLPRSTSLNLTVDIFGQSVNLLEFDGRFEGFEHYIESLFGPGGPYQQKEVGYILESLRSKRKINAPQLNTGKLAMMDKQFDAGSRFSDEPEMSLSMKILGNEIGYGHWEGRKEVLDWVQQLSPTTKLHNLMNGEEKHFSYAAQYIDSTHVIPLSVGLPLNLIARGQVVADFRGNMRTDLKSILSKGEGEIIWKAHPSASVNFNGAMIVDAVAIKAGVTLEASLHSSVSTSGKFALDGLRLFDLQIDLPQEKAEIITFKSDIILHHRTLKSPLTGIEENRVDTSDCTRGLTQRYLGLQVCSQATYQNASQNEFVPNFPLTGPSYFSLSLDKIDPSIKSYRFLHKIENTEALKSWVFTFRPEGSKESKEVGLQAKIEFKESDSGFLGFSLMLPSNSYETKGTFKWKEDAKTIEASFMRDKKEQLLVAKASLNRSLCPKQSGVLCFQPKLSLTLSDKKLVDLGGEIKLTEKKGTNKYDVNLNSTFGSLTTVSKGYYLVDEKSHHCNLTVDYASSPKGRRETIKIEVKVNKENSPALHQYDVHLEVVPTAYPQRNFVGSWRLQRGMGHLENVVTMNIGPMPRDNRNSLTIHQGLSYSVGLSPQNLKLKSHFEMTLPAKALDVAFIIGHEQTDYKTDSLLVGRYGPGKEIQCGMLFHKKPSVLFQASGAFNLTLPAQPVIRFNGDIQEKSKNNYKVDLDGVWGQDTDFQLNSNYENQIKSSNSVQQLSVSVTGSNIYPTEFVYTFQTNHTALEVQVQSSYGKDAVSLFISNERPTKEELKVVTKIGYLTYLHTVEAYWKELSDGQKGTFDAHIDKVIDVKGDITMDVASNGRREFSLDIQWDPNRNPLQKLMVKTSFEPSILNPNDWKSGVILSYPGSFIRGNMAALTQKNNRSLSGTIDLGSRRNINFVASTVQSRSGLTSEIVIETPFSGWKHNKAIFTSETKDRSHKTQFYTKYGPTSFFDIGLDARVEKIAELRSAEVSLGWKSSSTRLEDFQIIAKAELQPKILENTIKIKWGKDQEVGLASNLEWSFEGQVMVKNEISLTSTFPQLSQVKFEIYHNTEWESAEVFETRGSLIIDQNKYTALLKGENPGQSKRWEISAIITTPNSNFSTIGISSQYLADDKQPSFDLQLNWPGKEFGIKLLTDLMTDGFYKGRLQMKTPFEQFHDFAIDGSCTSPSDLNAFKLDLGTRWNVEEFVTFNATWDIESFINSDISVDLKTSFAENENYGTRLKLNLDLSEYPTANSVLTVTFPSYRIGFSANGTMTADVETGYSIDLIVGLDVADYPRILISVIHESKGHMDFKTTTLFTRGDQSFGLGGLATTTPEGYFLASLNLTTPLEQLSESEIRVRSLYNVIDDVNMKMVYEGGFKWKQFNQENKVTGRLLYETSVETLEDFNEKSSTTFEFIVASPWEMVNRLSLKGKQVNENSEIIPFVEAVFNNQSFTLNGKVNFIDSLANIVLVKKTSSQSKPVTIRMNTTWTLEDEFIKVDGTIATSITGFSRIPWNLEITFIDDENDENVWERLIKGEARLSNSQFILLNAAYLPTKLNANVATPFQSYKNLNLTIDYEQSSDTATSYNGEFRINKDQMEFTANIDWPRDTNTAPVLAQLSLNTPFEYELLSLNWASEDPMSAAELSLSWNKKNEPNSFETRYNFTSLGLISEVKYDTTVDSNTETWAFKLNSEASPDKLSGLLSLATPLAQFKLGEISAQLDDKVRKLSIIMDTEAIIGKLLISIVGNDQGVITVDTNLELLQHCQFKMKLNTDRTYSDMDLDVFAVWNPSLVQWGIKSKMKRSGWRKFDWSSSLSADSESKWLLDLNLDFEQVNTAYSHKIRYEAIHENTLYNTYFSYSFDDVQYKGQLGFDWGAGKPFEIKFTNKKVAKKLGNSVVEIITPWSEETLAVIDVTVDAREQPVEFKITAEIADRAVIVGMNIKYNSLNSMAAKTVVTTTYSWMPRAALDLNTRSERDSFNGSYALEWSNNNFNLYVFRQENDGASLKEKNLKGAVEVKTSWSKLPDASVRYSRSFINPTTVESRVQINHNSTELINALYKCNDKSSAGQELNQGQLEFRGTLFSGGLAFSRHYKYSGGRGGDNLPRSLNRTLDVYEIGKRSKFTLRIEFIEKETLTGQEYALKLSSPLRTVEFLTRSDFPDGVFRHGSEFSWRHDAKIAYEIEIENKTTATAADYVMTTSLMTPVRNIGLTGTMRKTSRNLRAVGEVVWDLKRRDSVVKVVVTWDNTTKTSDVDVHRLKIGFSQGNLPQELALMTVISRSSTHPLSMKTEVQYSNEPKRKLVIDNLVIARNGNYRYEMNMTHDATKLDLRQVFSYERNNAGRTQLVHSFSHSRTDAELLVLEHLLTVDQQEKKVDFSVSSPLMTLRHLGQLKKSGNTSYLTYEIQQDDLATKTAELTLRRNLPFANLVMKYDPENMKGLYMKAGMQDRRQAVLEVFNMDDQERIPFFDFAFRLNHFRLVTSKTSWRTDWRDQLVHLVKRTHHSLGLTADQWVNAFLLNSFSETAGSILNIGDDIILVLDTAWSNFVDEIEKLQEDVGVMKQNIIDGYYADAFFARIAVEIGGAIIQDIPFVSYAQSFVAFIEKTGDRILAPFTEENDSFSRWLQNLGPYFTSLSETVTSWIGEQWKWPTEGSSKFLEEINEVFRNIAEEYGRFIQQFQKSFGESLPDVWIPLRALIKDSWNDMYDVLRPILVRNFVTIESALWNVMKDVLDFLYKHREAVVKSSYFQKLSLLVDDLKQFYLDMQSTDWPSRIKKYLTQTGRFLKEKYSDIDDYLIWLAKLRAEIVVIYQEFLKDNPELQKGAENVQKFVAFIQWSYNHLGVNQKISDMIVVLRERGEEILRQTATDAQMRYSLQKTIFNFNPELGSVELEQKLPFPWLSLDETPLFEQLPEIQRVKSMLAIFKSSNTSAVDTFLSYVPSHQILSEMIPPFKSSAHLVGLQHFVTFDGRHFDFVGPCTYLLARDFLTKNFTLAVQYVASRGKPYATILQLVIDDAQWDLDLANRTVRVAGVNRKLPTEERGTAAYYLDGKFVVESPKKGVHLQCIATYDACTLTLSGWYNNKVAGLMGTMDNEPTSDLIRPNRVIELDLTSLARSWDVSAKDDCKTVENLARKIVSPDDKLTETCSSFFQSQRSTLKKCVTVIDPSPYMSMCLIRTRTRGSDQDGCHAAAAYASACAAKGVLLRIPPQCIRCQMENESLSEGNLKEIKPSLNRISTDVVVLLDLKKCNEPDSASRRFLPSLISSLDKELSAQKILKNRYSLVVFGGKAPYDTPKVRSLNGQEFVSAKEIDNLLQNLSYANGPNEVLNAVRFASHLNFRPGVSKTFIVLPCSSCESAHDHEITSQSLIEQDVTLHVLTDAEFRFIKPNVSRQFLGLDANTGFTPKEFKGRLIGDTDLRRQARLSKSLLGICAPVALQTNGTIFAVSRLREQRKNSSEGKRAVNVWVKRVTSTARATNCQKCTCNLKNYYESGLDCRLCIPRETPVVDTSFLVEEGAHQKPASSKSPSRSRSRED